MPTWLIEQEIDLLRGAPTPRVWPDALMLCGDSKAHEWRVYVRSGAAPMDLSTWDVTGYFRRADGITVRVGGTKSGHVAQVLFPQECYAFAGVLEGVLQISAGDVKITLAALLFPIRKVITDTWVDPGNAIPSLEQLLAKIGLMETGTAAATAAASAANTAAGTATSAAGQATEAAAAAQTAAATAGNAASAAQSAASGVVAATEAAQAAAQEASDAASDAVLAAGDADDATDAANAAAAAANTAASEANAAKTAADTAAEAATSAAGQATSAASAAQAGAAAANAATDKIDGMTVETSVVPYGTTPTATVTEVDGHKHVAIQTQRGPQGPGYTIKGAAYATLAALEAAVPSPAEGDQYNVGSAAPYHVYRWTGAAWEDQGELQGPAGDDGFTPTASVNKENNTTTIAITDKVGSTSAQVTDGADGKSAYELAVIAGYAGTEVQWLDSLKGTNGQGVPTGGAIGQALVKSGLPDFVTEWAAVGRTNANLLDNSDFAHPVNASGIVSGQPYHANMHYLDRWIIGYVYENAWVAFTSGVGLALNNGSVIYQYIEANYVDFLGRDHTVTVRKSDGTFVSTTGKFPTAVNNASVALSYQIQGVGTVNLGFEYRSGGVVLRGVTTNYVPYVQIVSSANQTIRSIKVEIGTISTHAMDAPENYAVTLAKCRRFYKKYTQRMWICYYPNAVLVMGTDETPMRIYNPTASAASYTSVGGVTTYTGPTYNFVTEGLLFVQLTSPAISVGSYGYVFELTLDCRL